MTHTPLHNLNTKEIAQKYLEFGKKLLEFGPKTPELTGHIQAAVIELRAARDLVVQHFAATQGLSSAPQAAQIDWDTVADQPKVQDMESDLVQQTGLSASGGVGGIRDIFTFLLQHPELLQLLFSLFKPAT